jgi:hypothetical protein
MQVGGPLIDRIELHGRLALDYLDEVFPGEIPAGRPPTFREMWPLVDPARVLLSSDGGGGNPLLHADLLAVARDVLGRGGSYEHQLALKRRKFFGDGTLNLDDLEIDRAFLCQVTGECQ